MKHKHAEVIHAWAEGIPCQYRRCLTDNWSDLPLNPCWDILGEYRIKPKETILKFRNFLRKPSNLLNQGNEIICVVEYEEQQKEDRQSWIGFISWVGDWQTIVLKENS